MVIQKADKGNTVVILDKCSYISATEEILNDNSKFSKLDIPAGKEINHIVNLEKRITSELKLLKDKEIIDKSTYKSIKSVGSRPGILYGLGKIHKETRNGIPPFHPILSAIGTPTYNLATFLLKFLKFSTANEFTVIDSFHFAEEISRQDSNLHMASLDVDSLFTNIPFEETIDICVDNLYSDNENPLNIPKHNFCNLLNIATKETFFMFNNKYYKQVDVVAMGSPLGPALANIFMCRFESKWLRDCRNYFIPVFYRSYIDDIFVLFPSPDHADKFRLGISALTGKRNKGNDDSAIKEHLLFCNHTPEFEDFSILASKNNDFKVTLMESLPINRDHPPLNKKKQSLPLELFDS